MYMKISVDGGALCSPGHKRFGNYSFTSDLLTAISRYDQENIYYLYSYCKKQKNLSLGYNIIYDRIIPKTLWMNFRIPIEELFKRPRVFLALNQAVPLFTKSKVISFSHGTSFLRHPDFYRYSKIRLNAQLRRMMGRSDTVVVSSSIVKNELELLFPVHHNKLKILPFGIPDDYLQVGERRPKPYFLFVGMNHRVKNIPLLLKLFAIFTQEKKYSEFNLKLVGPFSGLKNLPKNVQVIPHSGRSDLKILYSQAAAYITTSHYESFNYPVLEALSQGCPVLGWGSAIIPEMHKYVQLAGDDEEFVGFMKKFAEGNGKIPDIEQLKKEFSWQGYIKSLKKLYTQI